MRIATAIKLIVGPAIFIRLAAITLLAAARVHAVNSSEVVLASIALIALIAPGSVAIVVGGASVAIVRMTIGSAALAQAC